MRSSAIARRVVGLAAGLTILGAASVPGQAPSDDLGSKTAPAWVAGLGDSTLARLVGEALRANHDVQAAEARVRRARAIRAEVALDRFPTVTMAAGYTRQRLADATFGASVPDRSLWDTELRLGYELDVFGRVKRTVRARDALAASAREDVRDVERVITAELAAAYFELRGAEARLRVAEENAANQRRTLDLTRVRLDAGTGNAFDTERAEALLGSTLALVPAVETAIAGARLRIAVLTGRDPGDLGSERAVDDDCAPAEPLALPELAIPTLSDSLLRERPDVRSAERQLAAETAFVKAAKADYLPRLSLGGTVGITSTGIRRFAGDGSSRFAFGPMVTWPAFDLGRVKAGVSAARALESEARARYDRALLLAREEARHAIASYGHARERLNRLVAAEASSRRAAELARLGSRAR
ncbi:MAG: TolC family protein [Gemmatimonadales bacterium]